MRFPRLSLRTFTTLLLVVLSMALVLLSGEIYRSVAHDNQRHALMDLVKLKATEALTDLESQLLDIGLAIQLEPEFRRAFEHKDTDRLTFELDNQFNQYGVATGQVKLLRLSAYDLNFVLMAQSSAELIDAGRNVIICSSLLERARARTGTARLQTIAELCPLAGGRPHYTVLVPVGGLHPVGYIQIVADPAQSLRSIDAALGMPVKISLNDGSEVFRSSTWQDQDATQNKLISNYTLTDEHGGSVLKVSAMTDISAFNRDFAYARNLVMGIGGAITLLAVFVAILLLQKTTLKPIDLLTRQLRVVRQDRKHLGEQVAVQGDAEVSELATVFNEMSGELDKLYHTLERMAFTDALTELPNRARFQEMLLQAISLSRMRESRFGLILLDLDGFKEINDTLGHHVGDVLLQQVSERLKRTIQSINIVCLLGAEDEAPDVLAGQEPVMARLGGDEFAFLLPALTNAQEIMTVAREITETLQTPFVVEGNTVAIGGSVGITLFPDHGEDGETLLRRADIALYIAKNTRNAYALYDPAHDQNSVGQLTLRAELRNAIDMGELVLHYQPKLHIKTGRIQGVEALVRWQHPLHGLLMPPQFLPVAERSGLIGVLTQWVLVEALRQHNVWQSAGLDLKVAVNLSSRVLYDLRLPDQIAHHLVRFQVPPSSLELEITEDAIMIDPQRALEILARLNAMRIKLSIDDFGTGYSSLGYLKRLPVDEIKIDKTFVMEMEQSRSDAAIVHATIDLAHNLGLNVVAEGVESEGMLSMLARLNCDTVQGFYVSRPMPGDRMQEWLSKSSYTQHEVMTTEGV